MKSIKDELQYIILGDEPSGNGSKLKKTQTFLRGHAQASVNIKKQQYLKSEEAEAVLAFAEREDLIYQGDILSNQFISEGAEQQVYRFNEFEVIKTNAGIFYASWLDYFNSLLLHNYFFPATAYTFMGFKLIRKDLFAIVKQDFVVATEATDLLAVKNFLDFNGFKLKRNNDYYNPVLGLILEDLHDENVLANSGVLFFIDTVFYITSEFSLKNVSEPTN